MVALLAERGVPACRAPPGCWPTRRRRIPGRWSSAQRQIMDAVLASTGLAFGVTVCAEDVAGASRTRSPTCGRRRCWEAPGGCVVLEDSPRGIAAAQAAGCPVFAVPSMPLPAGMVSTGPSPARAGGRGVAA
jgi:beta-phosphoglucomutase-like phosphatase (HAD superfamily)